VRPVSRHMTVVFLGDQAEMDLDRISVAALVPAPAPEVEVRPEPIGLPRGRRPRLFALDAPSEGAVALQTEVERRLVSERLHTPEKRPFWPHLTVARVKPAKRGGRKPAVVESLPSSFPGGEQTFPSFCPTRLVLFRSHLRRTGAEYEPMAELELPPAT
jgi:RNA 2',3'-cyclic 3'-phosphodiesterase